jgi:signal peptidase II
LTVIKKPLVIPIAILLAMIVLDQGTKQLAQSKLLDESFLELSDHYPACGNVQEDMRRERFVRSSRQNIAVIENFFDLRYVENCASAFGMFGNVPESFRFPFFLIVSLLAIAFVPYLYQKTPADQRLMFYALPFVLGGAIGNLIDRLVNRYVIDFIDWYIVRGESPMHWPTFNIADAAIVIGIGLMLLQMMQRKKT